MADHSWLASLAVALGVRKLSKDVAHDVADELDFRKRYGMSRRTHRRLVVGFLAFLLLLVFAGVMIAVARWALNMN